jgi:acetoin utilization protein AcuB
MSARSQPVCASELMSSHVRVAELDLGLDRVSEMLADEQCHHIPVVDAGRPVGMISSRDLIRVAHERGEPRLDSELLAKLAARDVMSADLETIYADDSVDIAIERIGRGDIHALVVLDADDQLAGILTHRDLLHYLMR